MTSDDITQAPTIDAPDTAIVKPRESTRRESFWLALKRRVKVGSSPSTM
jgi:hypothetical protein